MDVEEMIKALPLKGKKICFVLSQLLMLFCNVLFLMGTYEMHNLQVTNVSPVVGLYAAMPSTPSFPANLAKPVPDPLTESFCKGLFALDDGSGGCPYPTPEIAGGTSSSIIHSGVPSSSSTLLPPYCLLPSVPPATYRRSAPLTGRARSPRPGGTLPRLHSACSAFPVGRYVSFVVVESPPAALRSLDPAAP